MHSYDYAGEICKLIYSTIQYEITVLYNSTQIVYRRWYMVSAITLSYEQARPLAVLAPRRVTQWTTQAIHHHLGDCSWVTLYGYIVLILFALTLATVMHLHAQIHSYSYIYTMLKVLHGHVFPQPIRQCRSQASF